ncbi:MAG: bifunctional phosphopantothenoylcysteine decarboxylase/phosphopantothenate--cysteine ligase CoaBC [Myxococcales bacterium]|nr:bifunctional phosphopantothenoylcysteine decarboxylase/phosphopantothenate--cysteine ligase CoaBC [Myxococcales bacterium]
MDRGWLRGRRVALGVGGGIAAYKSCELVRELGRAGAAVRVAMTEAARQFVTPLTFQSLSGHPVLTNYFEAGQEASYGHLDLARWAEAYLLAPATADLIARIRAGTANDAVTTSLLAFRGPVLLAPAMNTAMWENPITQANLAALLADRRYRCVGPGTGPLADGEVGPGRLAEVEEIVVAAAGLGAGGELFGKRVLITAGPTREAIDPVRFISNPSSGKMGLALAEVARARGAEVTVVLGPIGAAPPAGLEVVEVTTAEEMAREVLARIDGADVLIAAAAVGDWRPESVSPRKLKKSEAPPKLVLVRTPDGLAEASRKVKGRARRPVLIGFAAETERVMENAQQKLLAKELDAIVANEVGAAGAGFGADANRVTILSRAGERRDLAGSKREVAEAIWSFVVEKLLPVREPA